MLKPQRNTFVKLSSTEFTQVNLKCECARDMHISQVMLSICVFGPSRLNAGEGNTRFSYICDLPDGFLMKLKRCFTVCEHEYMNIPPPPPQFSRLATALTVKQEFDFRSKLPNTKFNFHFITYILKSKTLLYTGNGFFVYNTELHISGARTRVQKVMQKWRKLKSYWTSVPVPFNCFCLRDVPDF